MASKLAVKQESLLKKIKIWVTRNAKWYQFWNPKSGVVGGFIFAAIIALSILLLAILCDQIS